MRREFKVGDRVEALEAKAHYFNRGAKGTVQGVNLRSGVLEVLWDAPHYLDGVWYISPDDAKLLEALPRNSTVAPAATNAYDEFNVMRVCAAWLDWLPTDLEKTRVLKYLEDRFDIV